MIRKITTDDLRKMKNKEGLILQGCGGDLQEWQDGINDLLTKENILLDGSKFENCLSFEYNGIPCLLFPFEENVKLDTGKLAIWRLRSHSMHPRRILQTALLKNIIPNYWNRLRRQTMRLRPEVRISR